MFDEGIKGLSWFSLLKIKWVGFLFKYDILPESTPGIFSINETNDYVFVDRKGMTHFTYALLLMEQNQSVLE